MNKGLTTPPGDGIVIPLEKKFQSELARLKSVPGLDEHERILLARSLSATPQERWNMHENFLRSLGLFGHSKRKAIERIIASKRHVGRPKDIAHLPLLEQVSSLLPKKTPRAGRKKASAGRTGQSYQIHIL